MHKFCPENLHRLETQERYDRLRPLENLIKYGLRAGMAVADLGCGTGFFTLPAAKIVGESGKVYALDLSEEMLEQLKRKNPPKNVEIHNSSENELPLPDGAVDFVIMGFLLHELKDAQSFLGEVHRILKPKGRIFCLDWKKQDEEKGPPKQVRIEQERAVKFFETNGFKLIQEVDFHPSHYLLIVGKKFSIEHIKEILFPPGCGETLVGHCLRKLTGDYLPDEVKEKKAYGLVAGIPREQRMEVREVFPLKKNLRGTREYKDYMDGLLRKYGVPSETPFEERGWVADPNELMQIYKQCDEKGLLVFGMYHMHRVPWEQDPLRDTCTEIDRLLAQGSYLWVFIVSMVNPQRPIVRAFFEGNNHREASVICPWERSHHD